MKIQINNLVKSYAGDVLFSEFNIEIIQGSKVAIVGENGCGKSTFLKILCGIETYQEGKIIIPKDLSIGYMEQIVPIFDGTVREYVVSNFRLYTETLNKMNAIENLLAFDVDNIEKHLNSYAKIQNLYESIDGYTFENSVESYAKGLGIFDVLEQDFNHISGGQKTRVSLLVLLLKNPDIICLDEPTNHLDLRGIEWLEEYCQRSTKTLIIVSHDREFLNNIVSVYHEIEDGRITTFHGDYASYRTQRQHRFLRKIEDYDAQVKEIQRLKVSAKRYRQWGNESNNEDFYKRAKAIERRISRIERLPKPSELVPLDSLAFNANVRSGKRVVTAENLSIGYDNKALVEKINFEIHWKDCFAIIADNGVGKTTLVKTIMMEIDPIEGTLNVGDSVQISYLPQQPPIDDKNKRILDYIQEKAEVSEFAARTHLARFGFYSSDTYKPLSYLSGGEYVRLLLLEMMLSPNNCLILDEPTNHLDINSCEIIERVIKEYNGTVILISHDRMLLKNVEARKFVLK